MKVRKSQHELDLDAARRAQVKAERLRKKQLAHQKHLDEIRERQIERARARAETLKLRRERRLAIKRIKERDREVADQRKRDEWAARHPVAVGFLPPPPPVIVHHGGRTRDRSDYVPTQSRQILTLDPDSPVPNDLIHLPDGRFVNNFYQGQTTDQWTFWEKMTDVVGNQNGFNGVVHEKVWLRLFPTVPTKVLDLTSINAERYGDVFFTKAEYEPSVWELRPEQFLSQEIGADQKGDFAWDAYYDATTQVKEEDNLANFLLELGDLKETFTFLKERMLPALVSGFLSFEFGIKPFIKDIETFAGVLGTTRKRLRFLQRTAGKTYRVRYRREYAEDIDDDPPPATQLWSISDRWPVYVQLRRTKRAMYSTILVRNELERLESTLSFLNALNAALGLNNPLRIYWNSISLSFVAEWFVGLSNVFREIDHNYGGGAPFPGALRVMDSFFSTKEEYLFDVYGYVPIADGLAARQLIGYGISRRYRREKGLPFNSFIHLTGDLSSLQKTLLASLLYQRWGEFAENLLRRAFH